MRQAVANVISKLASPWSQDCLEFAEKRGGSKNYYCIWSTLILFFNSIYVYAGQNYF